VTELLHLAADTVTWRSVSILLDDVRRGIYVIGTPRSGKTGLLKTVITQFADLAQPFALFDPEGDLYQHALAEKAVGYALSRDDSGEQPYSTVLLEAGDLDHFLPLNFILAPPGVERYTHADALVEAFGRAYADEYSPAPRFLDFIRHSFLLGDELSLSLYEILLAVIYPKYRMALARASKDPLIRGYFLEHLKNVRGSELRSWTEAIRNKLAPFVLSPYLLPMLCQDYCVDFYQLIENRRQTFLCHLSAEHLKDSAGLLGMILQSLIEEAAIRRPENVAQVYPIVIDEFQKSASKTLLELSVRGGRRGIGLILAHQTISQPPFDKEPGYIETLLGTTHVKVAFRCGATDAERLSKEMFEATGELVKVKNKHWLWGDHGPASYYSIPEQRAHWAWQLQDQHRRECYVSLQGDGVVTHACETFDVERPEPGDVAMFREMSLTFHCVGREDALACIEQRAQRLRRDYGIKPPASVEQVQEELDPA